MIPSLMSRSVKKVVVVGGGVIGLCTAYYASLRGHEVAVLDRNPEQTPGCSFGNAGMIVPSHFIPLAAPGMVALGLKWMWNSESPFYIKPRLNWELLDWGWKFWKAANPSHVARCAPVLRDLHLASRTAFEELAAVPGLDFGLLQRGLVMLCKTAHTLEEEARTAEQARALGIPAEVLDPAAAARLDPNVRMDIAGAVYFPRDCSITPHLLMQGLRHEAQRLGARFHDNAEVLRWRHNQGRIDAVETTRGDFTADEFVIAGGSWSPVVASQLQLRLPMQAGKGYSVTVPNPRQLPAICSIFTEARVAVTPMGKSLRFGGTMEISGLSEVVNPARVRGILRAVPHYYPEFQPEDFDGLEPWRGLRPCAPDGMPYVGRFDSFRNLSAATGHAMMGLSLGPVTGKLMASILSGEKPAISLELLNPNRYA